MRVVSVSVFEVSQYSTETFDQDYRSQDETILLTFL